MMLRHPEATISELLGVTRQIGGVAQRGAGVAPLRDGRQVEDGHGKGHRGDVGVRAGDSMWKGGLAVFGSLYLRETHPMQTWEAAELGDGMQLVIIAVLALQVLASGPMLSGTARQHGVGDDPSMPSGQRQLSDLNQRERLELLELQRELNAKKTGPSETQEQCKDNLSSRSPTDLEAALLRLKCSQRPSKE